MASRAFPDNAFRGETVAVIGACMGLIGPVWSQAETRKLLGSIGADVIDQGAASRPGRGRVRRRQPPTRPRAASGTHPASPCPRGPDGSRASASGVTARPSQFVQEEPRPGATGTRHRMRGL
jgi:hypothetical protein